MNKTFKIRINYTIGIALTLILCWVLYRQVQEQVEQLQGKPIIEVRFIGLLLGAIGLGLINLMLEVLKWRYLVNKSDHISMTDAVRSFLTGIALSFITPNRIGEYPGRLIALEKKNTVRLISMSILGAFAQMYMAILLGNAGLWYYFKYGAANLPLTYHALIGNAAFTVLLTLFFFKFEIVAGRLERIGWLRKYFTYRRIVQRLHLREQLTVLGFSALRYAAFTAQLMVLFSFFKVNISPLHLLMLCFLFFWAMTAIPSVALAELGIRGQVSVLLFGTYSPNVIGILLATLCLWLINLALPALAGAVIIFKKRWVT